MNEGHRATDGPADADTSPVSRSSDADLRRLAARGDGVDPVRVRHALEQARARVFGGQHRHVALGRYVVLDEIGRGGCGVVYLAYDPQLHRRVALKVMHAFASADAVGSVHSRMLREAQAMAQLSHPNVVGVFDVGVVPLASLTGEGDGDAVFVVMEYVDGPTLRDWLHERPRSLREILAVFAAAGRGLAAAHERGLVHRDFKPTNVLVGVDGEARVVDFGLARAASADLAVHERDGPESPTGVDAPLLREDLTSDGIVLGTPAYMAPEQHRGADAGALTDEYAFCVALFEAVHGHKPFVAAGANELTALKASGAIDEEASTVPRWLRAVLRRGLSPRPQQRYPDMHALLRALGRPRARAARRVGIAAAAVMLMATPAVLAWQQRQEEWRECIASDAFEGSWNDGARTRLSATIEATEVPYAAEAWSSAERGIDAHVRNWHATRELVCREAIDAPAEAVDAHAGALACLDESRRSLEVLLDVLAEPDESTIRGAALTVAQLQAPALCRGRPHAPVPVVDVAAEADLRRAGFLFRGGDVARATSITDSVVERARLASDRALLAQAEWLRCAMDGSERRPDAAVESCTRAFATAEAAADDEQAFGALLNLAENHGEAGREREAWDAIALATAKLERLGSGYPELEAELRATTGRVHRTAGEPDAAVAVLADAVARYQSLEPRRITQESAALGNLAAALADAGRLAEAHARVREAIAPVETVAGTHTPLVSALHNNIGYLAWQLGAYAEAHEHLSRSALMKQAMFGESSPRLVTTLQALALVAAARGDGDDALRQLERSRRIVDASPPGDSALRSSSFTAHARVFRRLGRLDEAVSSAREALTMDARLRPAQHPDVAIGRLELGLALVDRGDAAAAAVELREALSLARAGRGLPRRSIAAIQTGLARAEMALGNADAAAELVGEGLAAYAATEGPPRDHAQAMMAAGWIVHGRDPVGAASLRAWAAELFSTHEGDPGEAAHARARFTANVSTRMP